MMRATTTRIRLRTNGCIGAPFSSRLTPPRAAELGGTHRAVRPGGSMDVQDCRCRQTENGMSVREAGRKGGKTRARYGSEFYQEIGQKGGKAVSERYSHEHSRPSGARAAGRWPSSSSAPSASKRSA